MKNKKKKYPKEYRLNKLNPELGNNELNGVRGLFLEEKVLAILKEISFVDKVVKTKRHSKEDLSGIDFKVSIGDEVIKFGVTVSSSSQIKAQRNHPDIKTLWIPPMTDLAIKIKLEKFLKEESGICDDNGN